MRIALYTGWLSISIIVIFSGMIGAILYKYNECCDPFTAGWVSTTDQLVPYLAIDIFSAVPGVAGLYVSGIFSGTLSTVSSGINSILCFNLYK